MRQSQSRTLASLFVIALAACDQNSQQQGDAAAGSGGMAAAGQGGGGQAGGAAGMSGSPLVCGSGQSGAAGQGSSGFGGGTIMPNCGGPVKASCYEGPVGTEGKGVCHAGWKTCYPDSSGYGPCIGQVTPSIERCDNDSDDDCDGEVNEGSCSCQPGQQAPCYSASAATVGFGQCRAGIITCSASGVASSCEQEVTPQAEACGNGVDDDCDGYVDESGSGQPCPATVSFARGFGSGGSAEATVVLVDAAGETIVAGDYRGTLALDGLTLTSPDGYVTEAFVAKFDAQGHVVSARSLPSSVKVSRVTAGSLDGDSLLLLVSDYVEGSPSARLVKLGSDLEPISETPVGCPPEGQSLLVDGKIVTLIAGTDVMIVTKSDAVGGMIWQRKFARKNFPAGPESQFVIARYPDGGVVVGVSVGGSLEVGDKTLSTRRGSMDFCLIRLSADGTPAASGCFGGDGLDRINALSVGANGELVVAGGTDGTVDLGFGPLSAQPDQPRYFAAGFDASLTPTFSLALPEYVESAATLPTGGFVLVGQSSLLRVSPSGAEQGSFLFGKPGQVSHLKAAGDSSGAVVLGGFYQGKGYPPPDFGVPLPSNADPNLLVARVAF